MSEEVNLSEESNNPEEVLDQDELLEKIDEMRQLIHQQRFTECKPLLVAVFTPLPSNKQYVNRLLQSLLTALAANMSLFQRKKIPDGVFGFPLQHIKSFEELDIPEMTPETRAKYISSAISGLDQLLEDIEMDIRSDQGVFKDLKKQGEAIDIKEVKPTSRNSFPERRCFS